MTTLNQSEAGAIQLDSLSETLVASTERIASLHAAIRERAERLRELDGTGPEETRQGRRPAHYAGEFGALKAQIRDLETELHAIIQGLPL